jgi:hypothetical protein
LRQELCSDISELDACISGGFAFGPKDKQLPYELLLDMDSFIFETRSLYEITGKFLVALFQILFARIITESDLQSLLASAGIDARWIVELQENRKLFFHQTAPWLAVQMQRENMIFDPILLKRQTTSFAPEDFVSFNTLREIYEGFVDSATELHRYTMEQIRLYEAQIAL